MASPDLTLLALHGLRLAGLAEADAVAEVFGPGLIGGDPTAIEVELKTLADADLVARRDGYGRSGWVLTATGRRHAMELVAAEVAAAGIAGPLRACYERFCALNPVVLDLCCRWQVREVDGNQLINDHGDATYDRQVIEHLAAVARRALPLIGELEALLCRFGHYGVRLERALTRIQQGDSNYVTGALVPSYHTVWFQLHEDLLVSLGLDRAAETARLADNDRPPSTTRRSPERS